MRQITTKLKVASTLTNLFFEFLLLKLYDFFFPKLDHHQEHEDPHALDTSDYVQFFNIITPDIC